jgi:plasmid stabilization system protein ParE
MAYEVIWLPKAEKRYDEIIMYLQEHWTEKEIINFIARTEDIIKNISNNPYLYRVSKKKNIHEAIITKHNILLYKHDGKRVELLTFFDTRQSPNKKFKK